MKFKYIYNSYIIYTSIYFWPKVKDFLIEKLNNIGSMNAAINTNIILQSIMF